MYVLLFIIIFFNKEFGCFWLFIKNFEQFVGYSIINLFHVFELELPDLIMKELSSGVLSIMLEVQN